MRLIDFIGCDVAPRCFASVTGTVTGKQFVVTENAPFTFPLRGKYGKTLELAIIGLDAWRGKVFEAPTMRTRPAGNRKPFHFGNDY
jgi:hypothetical protein